MPKQPKEKPQTSPPCAAGKCREPGEYKAPKSRWLTGQYQFLCLEHVREFNRAWDYFEGWTSTQIEEFRDGAAHGHRPTWKIGTQPFFTSDKLRDSFFRMMGEEPPKARKPESRSQRKEREALALLNLEPGAPLAAIKAEYKKLVKKYHPDVNRGDKASEETFKRITGAYTQLSKLRETSHEA